MDSLSKSEIMRMIEDAFKKVQSIDTEVVHKHSGRVIKIKFSIGEPEVKVDENGVEWVRKTIPKKRAT